MAPHVQATRYPELVFGLTFEKLLIIAAIAALLLGPQRLPYYASQLAKMVRSLRDLANGAKDRLREEMGPDFEDVDWKKLDPRQYDPRRIIRQALLEDDPVADPAVEQMVRPAGSAASAAASAASVQRMRADGAAPGDSPPLDGAAPGDSPPFDAEAT